MAAGRKPGTPKTGGRKKGVRNKRTRVLVAEVEASGVTPLEFMLSVMRSPRVKMATRFDAARQAAPYVHAKLAAIEHSGPDSGPVKIIDITDLDRAKALMALMAKVKAKTGAL
jgi:hypothetical protein